MDDTKFQQIATRLAQLSSQYTSGALKHYQYVSEYDKTLESYSLTKKDLVSEIEKRSNPNYQPEPQKVVPAAKPVPKKRSNQY
jgi:hypothetical protein